MIFKPYQGFSTFLKSPIRDLSRQIGVYGVPFDCATSFRPGARFGPNAIRQASMMLTDGEHPLFGIDPWDRITDMGDIPVSSDPVQCVADIASTLAASPYLQPEKRIMAMGGDHLVTLGVLRALQKVYGPLAVVHFDSHGDVWADGFDQPIGHGTWLRNAIDEGLVDPHQCISIGVRSPTDRKTANYLASKGGETVTAREAMAYGPEKVMDLIYKRIKMSPAYLTFDIDALDPAFAPGTGTPEIGGLTSMFALDVIERCASSKLVGMDVVEVSPPYDQSDITALAAATLLWTFAAGCK